MKNIFKLPEWKRKFNILTVKIYYREYVIKLMTDIYKFTLEPDVIKKYNYMEIPYNKKSLISVL